VAAAEALQHLEHAAGDQLAAVAAEQRSVVALDVLEVLRAVTP